MFPDLGLFLLSGIIELVELGLDLGDCGIDALYDLGAWLLLGHGSISISGDMGCLRLARNWQGGGGGPLGPKSVVCKLLGFMEENGRGERI